MMRTTTKMMLATNVVGVSAVQAVSGNATKAIENKEVTPCLKDKRRLVHFQDFSVVKSEKLLKFVKFGSKRDNNDGTELQVDSEKIDEFNESGLVMGKGFLGGKKFSTSTHPWDHRVMNFREPLKACDKPWRVVSMVGYFSGPNHFQTLDLWKHDQSAIEEAIFSDAMPADTQIWLTLAEGSLMAPMTHGQETQITKEFHAVSMGNGAAVALPIEPYVMGECTIGAKAIRDHPDNAGWPLQVHNMYFFSTDNLTKLTSLKFKEADPRGNGGQRYYSHSYVSTGDDPDPKLGFKIFDSLFPTNICNEVGEYVIFLVDKLDYKNERNTLGNNLSHGKYVYMESQIGKAEFVNNGQSLWDKSNKVLDWCILVDVDVQDWKALSFEEKQKRVVAVDPRQTIHDAKRMLKRNQLSNKTK